MPGNGEVRRDGWSKGVERGKEAERIREGRERLRWEGVEEKEVERETEKVEWEVDWRTTPGTWMERRRESSKKRKRGRHRRVCKAGEWWQGSSGALPYLPSPPSRHAYLPLRKAPLRLPGNSLGSVLPLHYQGIHCIPTTTRSKYLTAMEHAMAKQVNELCPVLMPGGVISEASASVYSSVTYRYLPSVEANLKQKTPQCHAMTTRASTAEVEVIDT